MTKLAIVFALVLGAAIAIPLDKCASEGWRIIGGSDAADGQFPYQISLRYSPMNNRHFCGGSIISPNWILTAAHCVNGNSPSDVKVVVGTNYLNSSGTSYEVSQIIEHENYNGPTFRNDIAVIKVAGTIALGKKVKIIELANVTPSNGTECVLSGWGSTDPSSIPCTRVLGGFPNLQQINLSTLSVSECRKAMSHIKPKVHETNICTYIGVAQGPCVGDYGGPLVAGNEQIGVASWGAPCARCLPDVYADVAAYRDWIQEKTGI